MLALPDQSHYPEGGSAAWLVVLGAWCAMIPSMGVLNMVAVLQAWVGQHQLSDLPESTIGWIFSTYAFLLYFCGAQVGPIFDTHNVTYLLVPGTIGVTLALVFMSFATEFYQFILSFGVLGGISASLLFNPSVATIGHWFYHRRAFATGVACTAGGLGGVIFPLIILYAAPSIGFPWAVRIIALICFVTGSLACVLLRQRLPRNKEAGAAIDLKALFKFPKFGFTALSVFLIEFAVFIPYSYISAYAIAPNGPGGGGLAVADAYRLNALLNVGAIPGRALPNYVADRFGTFNTTCITSAICATFIFGLWLTAGTDEVRITAFTVLYGFWSGAAISLTPVCVGRVCRSEDYGKRNGTAFFLASFGTLAGIPVAGWILQADNLRYRGLILFGGALYTLATIAFVVARYAVSGGKLRVIV